MKESLIGYVTALINCRNRDIEARARHMSGLEVRQARQYMDDLNDLLTFIEDTQEENLGDYIRDIEEKNDELVEAWQERKFLQSRIRELEDENENYKTNLRAVKKELDNTYIILKQKQKSNDEVLPTLPKFLEYANSKLKILNRVGWNVYDVENPDFYINSVYYNNQEDKLYFEMEEDK